MAEPNRDDPTRLAPVVLGLGAAAGYSGDDLTNPHDAVLAGEVPYLPPGVPVTPLELRIHGVGGAPPSENLETPSTLQVGGDGTAGFFRAWYPGGTARGKPQREAYGWGGLNTRSWTRALWLFLVAFMLVNVAYWALPGPVSRRLHAVGAALLRLLGLTLTLAFVGTALTVVADLLAWQAAPRDDLPSWTGFYTRLDDGPRYAIALLVVLAALGVVCWLSVATTQAYERWHGGGEPDESTAWPLTDRNFWHGERPVVRQRWCHAAAAGGEVLFWAGLPRGAHDSLRMACFVAAVAIVAVAAGLLASPWTDRRHTAGRGQVTRDLVCRGFAVVALVLATAAAVARFWWRPEHRSGALTGDDRIATGLVLTELALVLALFLVVLAQRAWQQTDVAALGLAAPLLALLGCLIGTLFSAALTLATANVLGTPQLAIARPAGAADSLYLPSIVYAGGVGLIMTIVMMVLFGVGAVVWMGRRRRRWASAVPDGVAAGYPRAGGRRAVDAVAKVWAQAALTDLAPLALAVVVVPTALVVTIYAGWLAATGDPGSRDLRRVAALGGTVGVLAIGFFLLQLRSALTTASARKRFGILWDVGTFWPRAVHPLAPPCYAERSVPEVVTRVRRIVGDASAGVDDPARAQQEAERGGDEPAAVEAHRPVLITGFSQGTPLAVAVVAQLPAGVRDRVALLTLAAPVRRLYGRTFPAYFAPHQLALLRRRLSDERGVRWRNLVRRSDYIGGWVLDPVPREGAGHGVDSEVLDPPALWPDHDPTPPPAHRHLDFFADPQTRAAAVELVARLHTPDPTPATAPALIVTQDGLG